VTNIRTKFEVSTFNDSRDMEGVPQFKSTSRDPFTTPFDLICTYLKNTL